MDRAGRSRPAHLGHTGKALNLEEARKFWSFQPLAGRCTGKPKPIDTSFLASWTKRD